MNPPDPIASVAELMQRINEALSGYSDKDWNYSRIRLQARNLHDVVGPYTLWLETIDVHTKSGRAEIKASTDEVAWGTRHSNELGILEIISLRLNKALKECTSDEFWGFQRPVVRVVKKQQLAAQLIDDAFWYEVEEVGGEEFENR
jgi:hypothetical protein